MGRLIGPVAIGVLGVCVLIGLGIWQVQRLAWKEAVLADLEARIGAAPVALPMEVDPARDAYLPVRAEGVASFGARVLASAKMLGAGYRMIDVFETGGRKVLLDRGFVPIEAHSGVRKPQEIAVLGNLHWPQESDSFTPDPDVEDRLWFARDVSEMADALGTEPVMIVAREITGGNYASRPFPVGPGGIPNNHLEYAITWFSLAAVWAGMTGIWLWRIRRGRD